MPRDDHDRSRRRRFDEDDDRDPPRRSRGQFRDEHERRPTQSRKRGRLSPLALGLIACGGALGLVLVAVVLYLTVFRDASPLGGVLGKSPPPGYSVVPGHSAGFTCYLPGEARSIRVWFNGVPGEQAGIHGWEGRMPGEKEGHASATSHRLSGAYVLGNTAEELFTELKKHDPNLNSDFFCEITAKNAITMDGKGGLELRYRARAIAFGVPVKDPAELAKNDREGEKGVYFVTTDGRRFFIIKLSVNGPSVDEEIIRTVRDSFQFR